MQKARFLDPTYIPWVLEDSCLSDWESGACLGLSHGACSGLAPVSLSGSEVHLPTLLTLLHQRFLWPRGPVWLFWDDRPQHVGCPQTRLILLHACDSRVAMTGSPGVNPAQIREG